MTGSLKRAGQSRLRRAVQRDELGCAERDKGQRDISPPTAQRKGGMDRRAQRWLDGVVFKRKKILTLKLTGHTFHFTRLYAPYMLLAYIVLWFKFYKMKLMNRQIQKERRKELRSNATISEKRLWKFLNNKQQDFKFRRQHGIGPYIVDFYLANK